MGLVQLTTPVSVEQARSLRLGDTVEITGRLYTGRDAVHHRLHQGVKPPVDLKGAIIYHCGPVVMKKKGKWVVTAAGPSIITRFPAQELFIANAYDYGGQPR